MYIILAPVFLAELSAGIPVYSTRWLYNLSLAFVIATVLIIVVMAMLALKKRRGDITG